MLSPPRNDLHGSLDTIQAASRHTNKRPAQEETAERERKKKTQTFRRFVTLFKPQNYSALAGEWLTRIMPS